MNKWSILAVEMANEIVAGSGHDHVMCGRFDYSVRGRTHGYLQGGVFGANKILADHSLQLAWIGGYYRGFLVDP